MELLAAARKRVSDMDVRYLVMKNPQERHVFEIYLPMLLGTGEFNTWETH
jgi:hypothetical protein